MAGDERAAPGRRRPRERPVVAGRRGRHGEDEAVVAAVHGSCRAVDLGGGVSIPPTGGCGARRGSGSGRRRGAGVAAAADLAGGGAAGCGCRGLRGGGVRLRGSWGATLRQGVCVCGSRLRAVYLPHAKPQNRSAQKRICKILVIGSCWGHFSPHPKNGLCPIIIGQPLEALLDRILFCF